MSYPELENKLSIFLDVVANLDQMYFDLAEALNALKRLHGEVSNYVVMIYRKKNREGYIRTPFYISFWRKLGGIGDPES